jgi:hypothetical protein
MQRKTLMRRASGHRVRTAAHHVLLFVRKPAGMSGPARGPAKVLPFHQPDGGGARHKRAVTSFTWGLVVLGVLILSVALVLGLRVGRELLGPQHFLGWFRV